jgi:hypothetical protein
MRQPTREEKERLRAKIREERKRQHEIVMETARKSDEEDMGTAFGHRRRLGNSLIKLFVMRMTGLSFKGRLIFGLLLRILLTIIALIALIIISSYVFKS